MQLTALIGRKTHAAESILSLYSRIHQTQKCLGSAEIMSLYYTNYTIVDSEIQCGNTFKTLLHYLSKPVPQAFVALQG